MCHRITIRALVLCALLGICPYQAMALGDTEILAGSGIAVGRDVNNSTLNVYNRDPEALQLLARQLDRSEGDRQAAEVKAAELARQLDLSNVTTQAVVGFLRVLARQPDLKLDQVPDKMAEITASYVQMQERLAALSPQDPTAADVARQAEEAGRAGQFEEADRLLEQAESRETTAIEEHRVKVAELRAARGDNAATQLHYTDAARHYAAAAALLPPGGSGTKAGYLIQAGDMWLTSGNSAAALTSYQAAHAIFERLAKADPGNAGWQRDLSVSRDNIGDVQRAQGDLAAALTSYQAAHAIFEHLAKADPGNAGWQRDLSVSYNKIGDVQQAQGDLAAARPLGQLGGTEGPGDFIGALASGQIGHFLARFASAAFGVAGDDPPQLSFFGTYGRRAALRRFVPQLVQRAINAVEQDAVVKFGKDA